MDIKQNASLPIETCKTEFKYTYFDKFKIMSLKELAINIYDIPNCKFCHIGSYDAEQCERDDCINALIKYLESEVKP
jgi:hypothetical protein